MSREQLIRNARANCIHQMDNPQRHNNIEGKSESGTGLAFQKGTYIRLFISCVLFLGVLAVKQFDLSYGKYDYHTIEQMVEDNKQFDSFYQVATETLKDEVIPVFREVTGK